MRLSITLLIAFFSGTILYSQDLHSDSNAVSLSNEANATTGWGGGAVLSSIDFDVQEGSFAMLIESSGVSSGRVGEYTFNVVNGETYNITIWAKRAEQSYLPAFANWSGFTGFSTTDITTYNWTAYNFELTANASIATIRIYTSPSYRGSIAGDGVLIDAVSIVVAGSDTEAPSAITDLAASGTTANATTLNWSASTDNVGVTDYEVFQDGAGIGLTGGATTLEVSGLTAETNYAFTVTARDAAGNTSAVSNTANVTTLASSDTEAPSAITDLAASGTTANATTLNWSASTDNVGVTDYEVFQDGASIGLTGGATTFEVSGLTAETNYAFIVTARDAAGNTSTVSNTVDVTTLEGTVGGVTDYTSENANLDTVDWQANNFFANGNVGIGTPAGTGYRLSVAGNIVAEEVRVALQSNWPDYVFGETYQLPSLEEVEKHIATKRHLINIPSAAEIEQNGIALGDMDAKLLRKIEELTLYTLQQEKKIKQLEQENKILTEVLRRVEELELKINRQ